MSLAQPSESRPLPVRLTDLRPEVRWSAAQRIAREDPGWGAACLAAALYPSRTVYYISADGWMDLAEAAA